MDSLRNPKLFLEKWNMNKLIFSLNFYMIIERINSLINHFLYQINLFSFIEIAD